MFEEEMKRFPNIFELRSDLYLSINCNAKEEIKNLSDEDIEEIAKIMDKYSETGPLFGISIYREVRHVLKYERNALKLIEECERKENGNN